MGIFFLPDLSSTPAPFPLEPKLPVPETLDETCPNCLEGGVLAGEDEAWAHWQTCNVCQGEWQRTLYLCEVSDPPHYVTEHEIGEDGICQACFNQAEARVKEDDPEGLERYLELKSRDLTPSEKALEIQAAKGYGWL